MSGLKNTGKMMLGFYFMILTLLMYYFIEDVLALKVFVTFRHVFALLITFSCVLCFLVKPNIARGVTSFKAAFVYSAPLFVTIVVSLVIWSVNLSDFDVISRGLSMAFIYINMFSAALAAGALLYIFGEKGLWYNLIGIIIPNIIMLVMIVLEHGIASFTSELITLFVTFAEETGDVIKKAEIHELAFCIGAYLVYMAYKPKKKIMFWVLFFLGGFCFVAAFKRIAMAAIAVALILGWGLTLISKYNSKLAFRLCQILTVSVIVILVAYIAILKTGIFTTLQESGLETSGRSDVYTIVDKFYEFSPEFFGYGIGYLTYQLNSGSISDTGVHAVHNDFLQHYIDLGFWGYIIWLVSLTLTRVNYFGKNGKTENAIISFILIVYFVISSTTDNTMNYPLFMTVIAIIMMGHGYDDRVRETETRMFGYISEPNKKREGRSIL